MNKNAYCLMNETFEKIAETQQKSKQELRTKFWKDRVLPAAGLIAATHYGSKAGRKVGLKLNQALKLNPPGDIRANIAKALTGDKAVIKSFAKSMALPAALGNAGGMTGSYGAVKAMQKYNENKGYAKATGKDTAKSMFFGGIGIATPTAIAKKKARKELKAKK